MLRNINNGSKDAMTSGPANTGNNSSSTSSQSRISTSGEQTQRTVPSTQNNNNQTQLLQQLRLISAQLGISSSNQAAKTQRQATTTQIQQTQQHSNGHQVVQRATLRPDIAGSNVSPVSSVTRTTNSSASTQPTNATNVDSGGSNNVVSPNSNSPIVPGNKSQDDLFPYILHGMLEDVERIGQKNIVSWNADAKSFRIHDPDSFVSLILEKYLKKYVGGIASRFTQFRSDLLDWGFEESVGSNRMGETYTHHCFQRGQPNLCRYMRCGRKVEEPVFMETASSDSSGIITPAVLAQSQSAPVPGITSQVPTMALGNTAQLIIQQAQAQANQQQQQQALQQQQQQQQALQVQALLNGLTNGSNPVATMIINQLAQQQQQQQRRQQQQQISSVMVAAAALQRQQQQQQKTFVVSNTSANSKPAAKKTSQMNGTMTPATAVHQSSSAIMAAAPMKQQVVHQMTKKAPAKTEVPAKNTSAARPALSAKRAAFLNKRSKATGAVYRNPNKKQKRSPSTSTATLEKNRKKTLATKPSSVSPMSSVGKTGASASMNAFTLNEAFKDNKVPDLLFPWKLHDMLDHAEEEDNLRTNVVSWQADGVSFNIHDKDRFVEEILPQHFENVSKDWDSFMNVLSSWGFVRFTSGTQKGAFIHRLLVKGKRPICKQMRINGKTVSDWMKQHCQFLVRLHALLCHADKEGKQSIVSWTHDGKKFTVHDPACFMNTVYPLYFDSSTFSSFEQKLRRWGFMRTPANHQKIDKEVKLENAVYSHPQFVRGKVPNLVWVKADTKIPRTLQQHNFLVRLRVMLSDASRYGHQFVVSWAPHGKAFMIHDRPYFSSTIMPNYFKSKFTSFRQSLRNHGFAQMGGNGWDEGAYYHKLFIREQPQLCQGLTQDQMKKAMPEWIPVEDEPNFYPDDKFRESKAAAAAMVFLKASTISPIVSPK